MGKVADARAALASIDAEIASAQRRLSGLVAHGTAIHRNVTAEVDTTYDRVSRGLVQLEAEASPPHSLAWDHEAWQEWAPGATVGDRGRLRIGRHVEVETGEALPVADTVEFVGSGRSLLITSRGPEQAAQAEVLLQSLVARLALMFPEGASFVLLEPAHSGGPLVRMSKALHDVVTATSRDQVRAALDAVTARIERIGTEHLSSARPTFEHLEQREQLDLGLQFVIASDVPNRLGEREIEALDVACTDGPEKGTYSIVHWNLDAELPITMRRAPFAAATRVDLGSRRGQLAGKIRTRTEIDVVGGDVEDRLGRIERVEPSARVVTWDEVAGVPAEAMWTSDSSHGVSTPLAVGGTGDTTLSVTFGVDADGELVSHGVVAGQTGKGKSRLLHALICGLAVRYSPAELELYLIDGKSGLEFRAYQDLPHAKVVSLNTPPALARSVLSELEVEMGRRARRFKEPDVKDLAEYRRLPDVAPMARIVCIIDEFQEVFQDDEDEGMRLLTVLTEKGRAFGIHVLLASQGFQPSGLRNAGKFYGNVSLRIALPLDRAELEAVDLFGGVAGRQMVLETCTTGGRVVINDRGGSARNRPGRVAFIDNGRVGDLVRDMAGRPEAAGRRPTVFDGARATRVTDHPLVEAARRRTTWPTAAELTELARQPSSAGGLGHARWQAGEGPLLVGIGRGLDVHSHTSAVLRRASTENMLIVGSSEPERLGMLLGAAALMSIVHPPGGLRLMVLDRTFPGSDNANLLTDEVVRLVAGRHPVTAVGPTAGGTPVAVTDGPDAQAGLIESLAAEVERRAALPEASLAAEPSVVLLAHDLDRLDALRQVPDNYNRSAASPLGQRLELVLERGPTVGVHVILSFPYVKAVKDVLSDSGTKRWFRHRVALQMSDEESFELLHSSAAARLPSAGSELGLREPVTAIYHDVQNSSLVKFKPYTTFTGGPEDGGIAADLAEVGRITSGWAAG